MDGTVSLDQRHGALNTTCSLGSDLGTLGDPAVPLEDPPFLSGAALTPLPREPTLRLAPSLGGLLQGSRGLSPARAPGLRGLAEADWAPLRDHAQDSLGGSECGDVRLSPGQCSGEERERAARPGRGGGSSEYQESLWVLENRRSRVCFPTYPAGLPELSIGAHAERLLCAVATLGSCCSGGTDLPWQLQETATERARTFTQTLPVVAGVCS